MNNTQYYLNHNYNNCPEIPEEKVEYLNKNNYLAEFQTDSEKENARCNLGITDIIELLNLKIDIKLLSREDIALIVSDYYKPLEDSITDYIINSKIAPLEKRMSTIESMFKSLIERDPLGPVLVGEFGDNDFVGINLKVITNALNKIWSKIEDITGEHTQGIRMSVTPDYFISEDGADISINAYTVETNGIFEHITFYANGILIAEADNVETFKYNYHIEDTTLIKCVAKIMGIEYTEQKIVTHYSSFWLGVGTNYIDAMVNENLRSIENGMKGNYDIECKQGDHFFVIIAKNLSKGYIRIDMNGFEVPTEREEVTLGGDEYYVFKSKNAYQANTYNIDINS